MLTDKQKQTFKDLKAGKLTARQKADFFYRMSNILKSNLDDIRELSCMFDELPESYLEKINLREAGLHVMGLTEKIVEKIQPAEIYLNEEGYHEIARYFKVDFSAEFPMLTTPESEAVLCYPASEEEIMFFNQIKTHCDKLEHIIKASTYDPKPCNTDEFRKVCNDLSAIRPKLEGPKQYKLKFRGSIDDDEIQKIKDLWNSGTRDLLKISRQIMGVPPAILSELINQLIKDGELKK